MMDMFTLSCSLHKVMVSRDTDCPPDRQAPKTLWELACILTPRISPADVQKHTMGDPAPRMYDTSEAQVNVGNLICPS